MNLDNLDKFIENKQNILFTNIDDLSRFFKFNKKKINQLLKEEILSLFNELKNLSKQKDKLNLDTNTLKHTIESLNQRLKTLSETLKDEKNKHKQTIDDFENKIKILNSNATKEKEKHLSLISDNHKKYIAHLNLLKEEKEKLLQEIEILQNHLTEKDKFLFSFESNLETTTNKLSTLTENQIQLSKEKDKLLEHNKKLYSDLVVLQKTFEEIKDEYFILKNKYENDDYLKQLDIFEEIVSLLDKFINSEIEFEEIEDKLDDLEKYEYIEEFSEKIKDYKQLDELIESLNQFIEDKKEFDDVEELNYFENIDKYEYVDDFLEKLELYKQIYTKYQKFIQENNFNIDFEDIDKLLEDYESLKLYLEVILDNKIDSIKEIEFDNNFFKESKLHLEKVIALNKLKKLFLKLEDIIVNQNNIQKLLDYLLKKELDNIGFIKQVLNIDIKKIVDFIESLLIKEKLLEFIIKINNESSKEHITKFEEAIEKIKYLVDNLNISNSISKIEKLERLKLEYETFSSSKEFSNYVKIVVSGGFSSGKSEFLSSILKNFRLPSDTAVTTAIPTYILHSNNNKIFVIKKNKQIAIDKEIFEFFTHQNTKKIDINPATIIDSFFIKTPIINDYSNFLFIDTPGYNPSGQNKEKDKQIAKIQIDQADVILWFVAFGENGTIPDSDIEFLKNLKNIRKPIYIVLNKADKVSHKIRKEIASNIKNILIQSKIDIIGITCYSSKEKKGYCYYKQSIKNYFKSLKTFREINQKQDIKKSMLYVLNSIKKELENERRFYEEKIAIFNELDFLLLEKLFHQKKLREEMDKRFVKKIKSHFENEISRLRLDIKKVEDVIYEIKFLDLNL